jgi:hypothetical protein
MENPMTLHNPNSGNAPGLPPAALPDIADMHVMSMQLVGLTGALDQIYQGGGGDKAQVFALIDAVAIKAKQLEDALEANYEAGVSA